MKQNIIIYYHGLSHARRQVIIRTYAGLLLI